MCVICFALLLYLHCLYVSRQVYESAIPSYSMDSIIESIKTGDIITTSTNYVIRGVIAYQLMQNVASLYDGVRNHTIICIKLDGELYGLTSTAPEKYYDLISNSFKSGVILVPLIEHLRHLHPTIYYYSQCKVHIPDDKVRSYLSNSNGVSYPEWYELVGGLLGVEAESVHCAQNAALFYNHVGLTNYNKKQIATFTMRNVAKLLNRRDLFSEMINVII